ncbi:uncharacterized protein B0P05DRAFT_558872 [Gilbertella persicaria]|uniref:uncharacterized protein n=1 Tax=Gilbertella persicaria TaxID=101096 RepID=UPI00221E7344|nr:uncharacterized protein B0P05DRAFT_558872 [Gilbertella persicaria]KAI8059047.1 hypothetical protein B0P05DRAFT_558872 [Gilbertella persicaria]
MQSMAPYYPSNYATSSPYQPATPSTPVNTTPSAVESAGNGPIIAVPGTAQPLATPSAPFPKSDTPKRNQVKNACTNCQKACKKCDDARPCPRCRKYGIADSCVNSVRKERKKGIKRGPYKRRQKAGEEQVKNQQQQQQQQTAFNSTATPPAAMGTPVASTNPVEGLAHPPSAAASVATTPTGGASVPDFGYPTQLSQYAQNYDSYNYAVNAVYNNNSGNDANNNSSNSKDHTLLSAQYVINPVYPSYPAPVLVSGSNNSNETGNNVQNNTETNNATENNPNSSSDSNNYHQAIQGILESAFEAKGSNGEKKQSMTPATSASGTASPATTDQHESLSRLSQLCTAALRENKQNEETKVETTQVNNEAD